jgi:hypothetical protein
MLFVTFGSRTLEHVDHRSSRRLSGYLDGADLPRAPSLAYAIMQLAHGLQHSLHKTISNNFIVVTAELPHIMVLGLLALAATIPMTATSVLGLQEKAESTKENGPQQKWKTEKCHMRCRPSARTPDEKKKLFVDSKIVLRDGKLYVQTAEYEGKPNHPFTGYYLPYPDSNFDGLVSTISDNPPQLNWIYLQNETWQVRHGLRVEAEKGRPGPWGGRVCSDGEIRFLLQTWEGFIGVETEETGLWSLCFDQYDDGFKGKLAQDQMAVELELVREELEPSRR